MVPMAVDDKLCLDLFGSAFRLNVSRLLGVLRNPGGGVTTAKILCLICIYLGEVGVWKVP